MTGGEAITGHGLVPRPWRVEEVTDEVPEVVTLHLRPVDGPAASFLPGQINMLAVPGVGEVPISVATDPAQPDLQGHTIRAAGAVTTALVASRPGDLVGVRGPFGTSWHPEDAFGCDVVFVAGGIGMAPLRAALHQVVHQREHYGRVVVCSGARAPVDLLYRDLLDDWARHGLIELRLTVDHPDEGWTGAVGLVPRLLAGFGIEWPRAYAFVCGPDLMMRATAAALLGESMAPTRVRLTLERNMKCAVALCGHCQLGPLLVCRDGPIVDYARLMAFYDTAEV